MIIKFQFFENNENLKKGDVVLRSGNGMVGNNELFLLLEDYVGQEWVLVFQIGNIVMRNPVYYTKFEDRYYASIIFNRKDGPVKIRQNAVDFISFRKLTNEEKKLLNKSVLSGEYNKYIEIIKDKTGMDILPKELEYSDKIKYQKLKHVIIDPYGEEDWLNDNIW